MQYNHLSIEEREKIQELRNPEGRAFGDYMFAVRHA